MSHFSYSPYISNKVTLSIDYLENQKNQQQKKPSRKPKKKDIQTPPPPPVDESFIKEAAERLLDEVFDTRETQQRLLEKYHWESAEREAEKEKLARERKLLAQEKEVLANKAQSLEAKALKQKQQLQELQAQLREAKKEAKKAKKNPTGDGRAVGQAIPGDVGDTSNFGKNQPRKLDLD